MKKTIFSLATLVAALLSAGSCSANKNASEAAAADTVANCFQIHRGTNLSHWLSQSQERGEARAKHIQEDDIARLDSLGFDFVRIPIDEEQFWDEKGNTLPEAWGLLRNVLNLCGKHHLRAIVDLHIIRSHYFNAENEGNANTLFTSEEAQNQLIGMWHQLSDSLHTYSTDSVAYEFMNEPVAKDHEDWNKLIAKVHKALRELEPNRTLVIGSNLWQATHTFKYLKVPEGDKNIILSFHFYEPMVLTHNTAPWTPVGKYAGKITYPGVMISQEDFAKAPEAIKKDIEKYTKEWNRDSLRSLMNDAIEVAKKYDLQLFCGEWGVFEPVDRELAYAWTRDMISVFNENGVAWATWCYDADFGFWDQKKHTFKDKPLVDILLGKEKGK
ncbi:MAG: cellulase family glycosylhydrolase [Bacteroidales bacterium]|nr:cellulase family glycosylhydrolase [Bacteroidales bacterium]